MYSVIMNKFVRLFSLFFAFIFLLLISSPVQAVQFKSGTNLNLPKGENLDESLFISGEQIIIDSDITGDLFCAGQSITINGSIKGDVLCVVQDIKINGLVDGNVRVAGQTVEVSGTVNRNLNALAQTLTLKKLAAVKGDIFFGVQSVDLSGTAGRDLAGAGETVTVSGSLFRNATVNAANLNISDTARIRGDLDYYIEKDRAASISSQSVVGQVRRHDLVYEDKSAPEKSESLSPMSLLSKVIFGALAFFIIASVLIYFDKSRTEKVINRIQEKPVLSGFIGLAVFVTFPLVFILLIMTLLGIPLAFVTLFVYFVALIVASVYTSIVIGWNFLKLVNKKTPTPFLSALAGTFTLGLIASIPVLGWLIALIAFFTGLGALFTSFLPEKTK